MRFLQWLETSSSSSSVLLSHAFNSLYEILVPLLSWMLVLMVFFQFSLWDSYNLILWNGYNYFVFQFSLWDSTPVPSDVVEKKGGLSILFMRFNRNSFCQRRICKIFQFSLWDSITSMDSKHDTNSSTFNSLYEILQWIILKRTLSELSSFNSLYEIREKVYYDGDGEGDILSILFMRFWGIRFRQPLIWNYIFQFSLWDSIRYKIVFASEYYDFQFSLWDSNAIVNKKLGCLKNFQFSLWDSYFFVKRKQIYTVNFQFSLWDSGHSKTNSGLRGWTLSILFMRFTSILAHPFNDDNLSILFMRFW